VAEPRYVGRRGEVGDREAIADEVLAVAQLRLEPVEPGAPVGTGELVHDALCFHRTYGAEPTVEHRAAWELLLNSGPAIRAAAFTLDREIGNGWLDEQGRFVEDLCRHFPGLAPAIRAVAYHLAETREEERQACCWPDRDESA
jgi:hypothetical protein